MRVVKVAYPSQWIRRRRKCGKCWQIWTSRERFDGARMDKGVGVVPESWPVVRDEKRGRRKAEIHADARSPLDEMVRDSYARRAGRV